MSSAANSRKRKECKSTAAGSGASGSASGGKAVDGPLSELDVSRLTKRQCHDRLKQMQKDLTCPICLQCSYCPFRFPCQKHYGCHACLLQLIANNSRISYNDVDDKFHMTSVLRCSYCGDHSRSLYCQITSLGDVEPAPHVVMNVLFGEEAKYKCPYCDRVDTMTGLCKHIQLGGCANVKLPCKVCGDAFGFSQESFSAHMRDKCGVIPCPHRPCRFRGKYTDLVEHCKPHRKLASLRSMMRYIADNVIGNPRFLWPKTSTATAVAEGKSALMSATHKEKFAAAIDTWKQQLLALTTELINVSAESSGVPPLVLLQRCGADRLCDAFNEDTNTLLTFEVDTSSDEEDDEEADD